MIEYDDFDTIIHPEDVIENEHEYYDDLSDQCVDAMIEPAAHDDDIISDIDDDDEDKLGLEDDGEDPDDILYDIEDGELEESILDSVSSTLNDIETIIDTSDIDDNEDDEDDEYFEYGIDIEDLE